MEIVFGGSGYLGSNLLDAMDARNVVCVSRNCPAGYQGRFDAHDMLKSPYRFDGSVSRVFILSRPVENEGILQERFAQNLRASIFELSRNMPLRHVVFASTQLVYKTPRWKTPISSNHLLGPESAYDRAKLATEIFLQNLQAGGAIESLQILRLPLLIGGKVTEAQTNVQLLYRWLQDSIGGVTWKFKGLLSRSYGNSWAYVPDLVGVMLNEVGAQSGVRVRNVSSGHFTYADLDRIFKRIIEHRTVTEQVVAPGNWFFMRDELGLPDRQLEVCLREALLELRGL